jgi:acetyl esterase/lipase
MDASRFSPLSRRLILAGLAMSGVLLAADLKTPNYQNISLWEPGKVPLATGTGPLDMPFLTVVLPPEGKRNSGSVVIAPGGSNIMLMYGAEGMDIAEKYNEWGVTAFILTYRMSPHYGNEARILDGKRAIQVVRAHSAEYKIDPAKVGYIGFSAGSNMGRSVVAQSGPGDPNAPDPIDRLSSRPDYVALVYGPGNATKGEDLKNFPPTFLMAAEFDQGPAVGNAQLFIELAKAKVPAEMHTYQKGHHGFGSGYADSNFADWMPRLEHFLKEDGFLPGGKQ